MGGEVICIRPLTISLVDINTKQAAGRENDIFARGYLGAAP
jgi:hypothetical protein